MSKKQQFMPQSRVELWVVQKAIANTNQPSQIIWKTITKPHPQKAAWEILCRRNADSHRLLTGTPNLMTIGSTSIEMKV
jgi:hypothetical protein